MSEPYWVAMASAPVDYQGVYDPAVAYAQGAVVLYNGVTYIAVNPSTGQTPPTSGNLGGVPLVTSLPGSPNDGDEIILTDSLSAGTYQWRLKYVAARTTNKWVCVGSTPLLAENVIGDTTASATYVALGAGPSLTVPLAGDYFVTASALISNSAGASGNASGFMGYDVGATAAADADAAVGYIGGSVNIYSVATRVARKTGLAASTVLASKYKVTGTNTMLVQARRLLLEPIAVGG